MSTKAFGTMRIEFWIISAILLLFLLTLNAYSQSFADAARAERETWAASNQNAANILNAPIGSSSAGASSPQQIVTPAQNRTVNSQKPINKSTIPEGIEAASVSGNWSLELYNDTNGNLTLDIFQNGNTVFGKGHLLNVNNYTVTATAYGSVSDDKLNVGLVTLEELSLYQLSMTIDGNSAIGSYTSYATTGSTATGIVKGIKSSLSS